MCKQENLWTRWQNDFRAVCHPCAPVLRTPGPTECHSSLPHDLPREASSEPATKGSSSLSPLTLFCLTTVPVAPKHMLSVFPSEECGSHRNSNTRQAHSQCGERIATTAEGISARDFRVLHRLCGHFRAEPQMGTAVEEGLLQPAHEAPGPRHVMGQVLEGVGQR